MILVFNKYKIQDYQPKDIYVLDDYFQNINTNL